MLPPATPDAETLLRAIAAAAPGLWFPQAYADRHGVPRDALTEPLWLLRQTGVVEVGDWVKGHGQGLRLTAAGERVIADTATLPARPPSRTAAPPPQLVGDAPAELDRGDAARAALFDPPPAILAPSLLYANLAWFIVGAILSWRGGVGLEFLKGDGHPGVLTVLMNSGAVTASAVLTGDWWRLATCCFVHIGLLHLFCNVITLAAVGPFAEGLWKQWRFAAIYAVAGVAGSVFAIALHPFARDTRGGEALLAGASGALWGMLAGVVVWVVRFRRHLPPDFTREFARKLPIALVINVGISFLPGVSAEAHLGGAVAGGLVAWSIAKGHPRPRLTAVAGIGFTLLLTLLVFASAVRWSDDWKVLKERERERRQIATARRLLEEERASRAAVRAAVGEDWDELSPAVVNRLHERFLGARLGRLVFQKPGPATLRAAADTLQQQARAAANRVAGDGNVESRFRPYFTAVATYAAAVRDELDRPGRPETPEVETTWRELTRAAAQLGQWE